jgi:hypothetical protein
MRAKIFTTEGTVMEHSPSEIDLLRAELAELRKEVATLQARPPVQAASTTLQETDADAPASNRRGFLRLAGAAAVGATAVAVAGTSQQAAAATGGPVLIGQSNSASAVNDTTRLFSPSATALDDQTFLVQNFSLGSLTPPSDHRVAVAGMTSGADTVTSFRTGVYGRTSAPASVGGQGVFGSSEGPDNPFASGFSFGVVGTGGTDGYGVFAYSPVGAAAVGVLGRADEGFGVIASSFTGVSLYVRNGGRVLQDLRATGAPASGAFTIGEMIRDGVGDMYICTASGTPGTWRKVTAQHPSYANAGGSINLLARPIRLIDTRGNGAPITNGSAKLTPGTALSAQITGTVADSLSVPAGAKGILGNLTATEATGNGFALVWPVGQPQPATSNINYSVTTSTPAIANYFISAIDAAGKLNVMCSAASTHVLLDVFGFVF